MTMKATAAVLTACALLIAGCALPLASSGPAAKPQSVMTAPEPHRSPSPTAVPDAAAFAALVQVAENCAAGAEFPGLTEQVRVVGFGACLGDGDVPPAFGACAEKVFGQRRYQDQGAEAVARGIRAKCKTTITERN